MLDTGAGATRTATARAVNSKTDAGTAPTARARAMYSTSTTGDARTARAERCVRPLTLVYQRESTSPIVDGGGHPKDLLLVFFLQCHQRLFPGLTEPLEIVVDQLNIEQGVLVPIHGSPLNVFDLEGVDRKSDPSFNQHRELVSCTSVN